MSGDRSDDVRLLIVDDQPLVRRGLRSLFVGESGIDVIGEAVDGADAVYQVGRQRPDVVLMDVNMPRMDGLEATRRICAAGPDAPGVIILTVYDDDETLFDALRAGAAGFVLKDAPTEKVVEAIQVVAAGEALLSPRATRRLVRAFARRPLVGTAQARPRVALTQREHDVLDLVVQGHSNEEIAELLFLAESTIKSHLQSLYRKLGARDRAHVVIYAYEHGLVDRGRPPAGGTGDPPGGGSGRATGGRRPPHGSLASGVTADPR
ncbi:response regulator transcription factor [Cryptosporangium minutisporangium]|uniref:Response regulator transcription factor n=1 Tax=Cryptosporangium minutisporangium TaxID=113569 RepID=A0ABP6SRS3_9ACTN